MRYQKPNFKIILNSCFFFNLLFYNKKVHGNAYANNNSSTNDSSISDSYTIYDIEYVFV